MTSHISQVKHGSLRVLDANALPLLVGHIRSLPFAHASSLSRHRAVERVRRLGQCREATEDLAGDVDGDELAADKLDHAARAAPVGDAPASNAAAHDFLPLDFFPRRRGRSLGTLTL